MKTQLAKAKDKAWAHHPRGGKIEGIAGPIYRGLYGRERKIASSYQDAKDGLGYSVPATQCYKY